MLRCKECKFHEQSCKGFVESNFTDGAGSKEKSEVMVILDSPFSSDVEADSIGNDSNYTKALDRYLKNIGLGIDKVYLTSFVKCFISDKKKKPTKVMKQKCVDSHLSREIKEVKPKVIFLCGRMGVHWFLPDVNPKGPLKQVVGKTFFNTEYNCHIIPIYDMYYLNNFSGKSSQAKMTEAAFGAARVIIDGKNEKKDRKRIKYEHDIKSLEKLGEYVSCDLETTGLNPREAKIITISLTDVKTGLTVSFDAQQTGAIVKCKDCSGKGAIPNVAKQEALDSAKTEKQQERAEKMDETVPCPVCGGAGKVLIDAVEKNEFYTKIIPACIEAIKKRKVVYHNAIFDLQMFMGAGYDVTDSLISDTRLMQFLVNPLGANALGFLVQLYYGVNYKDAIDRANLIGMEMEDRRYYCAEDTFYTGKLFIDLFKKIKQQKSLSSNQVLTNMIKILTFTEFYGIKADKDKIQEIITVYEKEKLGAANKFRKRFKLDDDFNLNSPKQMCALLFGKEAGQLGLTPVKKTKTGSPSTDKDSITALASKRPALKTLTEYKTVKGHIEKLIGYQKALESDGRIHSRFNLFSPDSSRLMSSKPNIQNVPRDSRIKEVFVAREGYSFVYYDYSQIEFRVLLHLARDKKGLGFVNNGRDIHAFIASEFYREPEEDFAKKKTPEHAENRNRVKTIVYGTMYGRTPEGIVGEHGGSIDDAKAIQRIFFSVCREGYFWLNQIEQKVFADKKLRTPFGTYRFFPDVDLTLDEHKKAAIVREAKSFIIQSWAAELVFLGMYKSWMRIRKEKLDAIYIHSIHDAAILEVKDSHVKGVVKVLEEEAQSPYPKMLLPLDIELKVGKSWEEVA